jgi:hypothetical protein
VIVDRKNSSREFRRATNAIRRGTMRVEKSTIAPSRTIARTAAMPTFVKSPAGSLSSGRTIINGTTARS